MTTNDVVLSYEFKTKVYFLTFEVR